MPTKLNSDNPPAKPSKPSARLSALVTATNRNRVTGTAIHSGSGVSPINGNEERCTPPTQTTTAAAISCPRNFALYPSPTRSSQAPNNKMTAPPSNPDVTIGSFGAHSNIATKVPTANAIPPTLAIGA